MSRQLDSAAVAALMGWQRGTVSQYLRRGVLPPPDGRLGGSPWWWRSTIEQWQASRPGQGAGGGRPPKSEALAARARKAKR